jgi:hypothetical protein
LAFFNMASISLMRTPYEGSLSFTFNDSRLCNEGNLFFKRTKRRA